MRVLHVHSGNLYGGVETFLATLARCRDLAPSMETTVALCFDGLLGPEFRIEGVATPLQLSRGFNALWSQGGILYAPPMQ